MDGAEGAVLAIWWWRWGDQVAEFGGERGEVWDWSREGKCVGGGLDVGFGLLFKLLEVLGREGLVERWWSWECGTDGSRLGLFAHGHKDGSRVVAAAI